MNQCKSKVIVNIANHNPFKLSLKVSRETYYAGGECSLEEGHKGQHRQRVRVFNSEVKATLSWE